MDMNDLDFVEGILECYVEIVSSTYSTKETPNKVDKAYSLRAEIPSTLSMYDLLCEQYKDVLCQDFRTKLDESDSLYLVVENEILSKQSRLDGGMVDVISGKICTAFLYQARSPAMAEQTGGGVGVCMAPFDHHTTGHIWTTRYTTTLRSAPPVEYVDEVLLIKYCFIHFHLIAFSN